MLQARFSDRWDTGLYRDSDGRIFIDDDPELFALLLSQLRSRGWDDGVWSADMVVSCETDFGGNRRKFREYYQMVEYFGLTAFVFPLMGFTLADKSFIYPAAANGIEIAAPYDERIRLKCAYPDISITKLQILPIEGHNLVIGWISETLIQQLQCSEPVQYQTRGTNDLTFAVQLEEPLRAITVDIVNKRIQLNDMDTGHIQRCRESSLYNSMGRP